MTPLALALIAACVWAAAAAGGPPDAGLPVRYVELNTSETLTCGCSNKDCQAVYWFRQLSGDGSFQFLMFYNNAGRNSHGNEVNSQKFKGDRREGTGRPAYVLHIKAVGEEDRGLYSCVVQYRNGNEVQPGVFLRPGERAPTPPPTPGLPKISKKCPCTKRSVAPEGCHTTVLGPLVAVILGLVLALLFSVYYYSRLPKKCRHQFVKKKQMM